MLSERNEDRILNSSAVLQWILDRRKGSLLTTNRREDIFKWASRGRRAHVSREVSSSLMQDLRESNSGGQIVAMMQTAAPRHRCSLPNNTRILRCSTASRRSFRQREMRPVVLVVPDVLVHRQRSFGLAICLRSNTISWNRCPKRGFRLRRSKVKHVAGPRAEVQEVSLMEI